MGLNLIAAIVAAVLVLFSLLYYKYIRAKLGAERLARKAEQAEKEKRELKNELATKELEAKNAQIAKNHTQTVGRISSNAVDEQLHTHGYFRDGDGVRGVQPDLSESGGHNGNEATSAGAQSDL